MRKLASVQRMGNIEAIPNADAIAKASVLGWQLVVKKGEFSINELCIYIEIDSVLPERAEFEFLRNKQFRIRTIKMRGQISQGICFPVSILPKGFVAKEGMDVTEALGIVKYEPPVPAELAGLMKGPFPSFIPKTDETRVQVLQELLDEHTGKLCYITEKVDGTSVTYFVRDGMFGVCSRNMELKECENNTYWKVARQLDIEAKLKHFNRNIAIQGELVGENIQGNKLGLKGQTVLVFSVFWIDAYKYAPLHEMKQILTAVGLTPVPVITEAYVLENDIQQILKMANTRSAINSKVMAEGIVIRVLESEQLVSFKAINNEFLLKYED